MSDAVTREELIEDLQRFAEELGKSPTRQEFNEYGPHYAKLYQNAFGTWNEALKAAGLEPNLVHNIAREELLADIERVAGVLGKTPTLNDMGKYGTFSRQTYQKKLGSFVEALEELGLQPSYAQYNFSDREAPPELQATKNVRKLRDDGPSPASELPMKSTGASDKRHGLTKFMISTGQTGNSLGEPIYYLFGEHEPEEVLRKFFEINPQILEHRTRKGITEGAGGHGKSWREAAQAVLDEFEG